MPRCMFCELNPAIRTLDGEALCADCLAELERREQERRKDRDNG